MANTSVKGSILGSVWEKEMMVGVCWVLLACACAFATVSGTGLPCRDQSGNAVDWWMIMKVCCEKRKIVCKEFKYSLGEVV